MTDDVRLEHAVLSVRDLDATLAWYYFLDPDGHQLEFVQRL